MSRQNEFRLGVAVKLDDLGGSEMNAECILHGYHEEQMGN
jgi:hypothetical protein